MFKTVTLLRVQLIEQFQDQVPNTVDFNDTVKGVSSLKHGL